MVIHTYKIISTKHNASLINTKKRRTENDHDEENVYKKQKIINILDKELIRVSNIL